MNQNMNLKDIQNLRKQLDKLEADLKKNAKLSIEQKYFKNNKSNTIKSKTFLERVGDFDWYDIRGDFDDNYGDFVVYAKLDNELDVHVKFSTYINDDDYMDEETGDYAYPWNATQYFEKILDKLNKNPNINVTFEVDDDILEFDIGTVEYGK